MDKDIIKLNLGCGKKKLDGYINVDKEVSCQPDILHDLDVFPYPLADDHFKEVTMDHVMEHLKDPLMVLGEIYRVSADGAAITIKTPHFSCNWLHPRHCSAISTKLFDFLNQENEESYGKTNFSVESIKLRWMRNTDRGRKGGVFIKMLARMIDFLANIDPAITERIWCYWVGGFEEIVFTVKAIKKS